MSPFAKTTFAVTALLLLAVFARYQAGPSMNKELTERTQQQLSQHFGDKVSVQFNDENFGFRRIAVLSGNVPQDQADAAKELVKGIKGVHTAVWEGDTIQLSENVSWQAQHTDNQLVLSGTVPSDSVRGELLSYAKIAFPDATIVDQMTVTALTDAAAESLDATQKKSLFAISKLINGTATIENKSLTITGAAKDEAEKNSVTQELSSNFPQNFQSRADINVLEPAAGAPEEVVAKACQEDILAEMKGKTIEFDTGKAVLRETPNPLLDNLYDILQNCPDATVVIGGHTDRRGYEPNNLKLSENRAQSVAEYLAAKGLAREKLKAEGYGSAKPLSQDDTPQAYQQNRRIEFTVTAQ